MLCRTANHTRLSAVGNVLSSLVKHKRTDEHKAVTSDKQLASIIGNQKICVQVVVLEAVAQKFNLAFLDDFRKIPELNVRHLFACDGMHAHSIRRRLRKKRKIPKFLVLA